MSELPETPAAAMPPAANAAAWRRLPVLALGPLTWPVLRTHWRWIIGGTAGGGWQLKNMLPASWGAWALPLLFVLLVAIVTFLRWRNLRFYMDAHALHIRRGGISREETILEFARIQGLQVHQGLLLRLFGLYDVALETSGSESDAAHLPAVNAALLQELRQHLQRQAQHGADLPASGIQAGTSAPGGAETAADEVTGMTGAAAASGQPFPRVELHRLAWPELLRMALTSVQTLAIGPLLIGLLSRMQDNALKIYLWRPLNAALHGRFANWSDDYTKLLMLGLALLGSAVMAVVWGTWRYGGYHLLRHGREWQQQSGLLTPYTQTLNPARTCGVIWSQNLLQRLFGRGWMRVAMAGDSGARRSSEEQLEGKNRAFRVPWLSYRKALRLQQQLFASQQPILHKQARYQALDGAYLLRNRLAYLWLPLVLTLTLGWSLFGAARLGQHAALVTLAALLWLGLGEWLLRARFASWRFAVAAHSLRLQQGVFNCKRTLLPWNAVQTVYLKQSPLDRWLKLAEVELLTPFGRVTLPCLPQAEARVLFDYAAAQAIL